MIFSADVFSKAVRLITANQSGFLTIADDGATYYSTPSFSVVE